MKEVHIVMTYSGYEDFTVQAAFTKIGDAKKYYKKLFKKMSSSQQAWNNENPDKNNQVLTIELNPK